MTRIFTTIAAMLATLTMAALTMAPGAEAMGKAPKPPKVAGMVYTLSDQGFDDTWNALVGAIDANPNLRIVTQVDHAAGAAAVGLELDPNRVVFFGNPNVGTPLMQSNQLAGIDLPQRLQVIEVDGAVFVGFNDATFLAARHDLGGEPALETIAAALRNLTAVGAGDDQPTRTKNANRFANQPALTTVASDADIETTWTRLLAAIEASPASIVFTLDHEQNAANVGLDLAPTRLVVFGNPNIGTPIMVDQPTAGIDLPLKILVWEGSDGVVRVSANDPALLERKHKVDADLSTVAGATANFLNVAAGG